MEILRNSYLTAPSNAVIAALYPEVMASEDPAALLPPSKFSRQQSNAGVTTLGTAIHKQRKHLE